MKPVHLSFHSGDVLALPYLSPLTEREGANIVFVFPCPSSLVPVINLCASARVKIYSYRHACRIKLYSNIRCHQRLRLAGGYRASSSSIGGILDNIQPGSGGFSL